MIDQVQSAECKVQSARCKVQGATGTDTAVPRGMVARQYQDLSCWQLADELKRKVYELVDSSEAAKDFKFRDQIKGSAASAPANLAEGFSYYEHPLFAKHVRIAKAELTETHNHLADGVQRCYWQSDKATPLQELAVRANAACTGLLKHLVTSAAPVRWGSKRRRPGRQ